MVRLFILIFVCLAVSALFVTIAMMDASVAVTVGETSHTVGLAIGLLIIVASAFLIAFTFTGIGWLQGLPARLRLNKAAKIRAKGLQALRRGLVAAAVGDGDEALKQSQKANQLLLDEPVLTGLLSAQAAETKGDRNLAETEYKNLLDQDETYLLARRGLTKTAVERGDKTTAIEEADKAYEKSGTANWAFESAFDLKVDQYQWQNALDTLDEADRRKILTKDRIRRRRAVLLAAIADSAFKDEMFDYALQLSKRSIKLAPGFSPASHITAQILTQQGKISQAKSVIEKAWIAGPHPAFVSLYKDLKSGVSDQERITHLRKLVGLNASHRESEILDAELLIQENQYSSAQKIIENLMLEGITARLCEIMAEISHGSHQPERKTHWLSKAAISPMEEDWSDLDPELGAFSYMQEDWARLVYVYGDTASLIHPRMGSTQSASHAVQPELLLPAPDTENLSSDMDNATAQQDPPESQQAPESPQANGTTTEEAVHVEEASPSSQSMLDAARGKINSL